MNPHDLIQVAAGDFMKGFVDPVVSITENQVDVVLNAASLTDPERAQIEDIVKRKTEIGAEGIVITLMELTE